MEKIPIAKIIEFRRKKSESTRATLINNLKKNKEKESSSKGGHYWTTSVSAISAFYKTNNFELIIEKIDDLLVRQRSTNHKGSKIMYQKNIEILYNFEDFDFTEFKPKLPLTYISKPIDKSIIEVNGIPIQVRPQHVYKYKENNIEKIGAIWFVAKKDGFESPEIGIFSEALYKYLYIHYSENFEINTEFCIAQDVTNLIEIKYTQIKNNEIPSLLNLSLESIKKFI